MLLAWKQALTIEILIAMAFAGGIGAAHDGADMAVDRAGTGADAAS